MCYSNYRSNRTASIYDQRVSKQQLILSFLIDKCSSFLSVTTMLRIMNCLKVLQTNLASNEVKEIKCV